MTESKEYTSDTAAWLRTGWAVKAAALGLPLGPIVFALARLAHLPALAVAGMLAVPVGLLALAYAYVDNPWPSRRAGKLVANREGVSFNGDSIVDKPSIKEGLVVPRHGKDPVVRLTRAWKLPVEIEVADVDQGSAMLRALGLDASQSVARFQLAVQQSTSVGLVFALLTLALIAGFVFPALHVGPGLTRAVLVLPALALLFVSRAHLSVGADGMLVTQLGKKRFIRYDEVDSVEHFTDQPTFSRYHYRAVRVTKRDGEQVTLRVATTQSIGADTKTNAVIERIRQAMEAFRRGDAEPAAMIVRRGERDAAEWLRNLRAAASGANADHRTAPVVPEQLWRIVEDPGASDDARAGAAVVLGTGADEDGRARLRAAAEATAAPKVRVALEAAVSNQDDALVEALAALETPEEEKSHGSE